MAAMGPGLRRDGRDLDFVMLGHTIREYRSAFAGVTRTQRWVPSIWLALTGHST